MDFDDDDWGLSAEQLDSLEKDAYRKIAQQQQQLYSSSSSSDITQQLHSNNTKPIFSSPSNKVESSPIATKVLSTSIILNSKSDESSKGVPKLSVKFLLHASGNIAAKFSYDPVLVAAIRKIPRASWNAKERLWIFPVSSLLSAAKVFSEISGFNVEVENLDPLVQRAISAASASPDLRDWYDKIPSYIESKLLPFQRDGVRFVLQHGGRALLADEMGLGKTLQAIAVAACLRDSWPVLILAPSSLRLHWASMIQQWLNIPSSDILVVLSQWSGSNRGGFTIVSSNTKDNTRIDGLFNIISYDVVPKLQNVLMASEFKVVIADESHFMKNAQAKRTTASLPVIKKAQYAILLSGTPALSRPIELFKQLEALYPGVYKNVHEYGNRYCKGGIFGVYQGASNHEELHNLMKATVMIRRLKKDVLSELPVKRRQQVFIDLAEKDMKKINALFRELEVVKGKIKACSSAEEVESLKFSEKNLINKIYTDSAEAKIPGVIDYLGTVIEAGCKFLIFAHHLPMIDSIHDFLLKKKVGSIRIDGSTPPASRQALVTDFQEKDAIKAAVVSSVNIYYLLANDTVDDIIWDVVQSKLENLGQVLDGHEDSLEVSVSQQRSSPGKQKTLDSFLKRCNGEEHQSKVKCPRQ
ncbi:SWI/SNF-related matrix-associated actin-dependent regulator of chromatin subfamily A-like protein 1 isoform X4 [Manihot esculenta]|uniref:SWI/SNF-related matrix-associated actin-dependent regulator of chromatin subfamily A-like protein 1 isoform X4 n=1 Tax=Manihot esculenta TaxID=3983 RepID=UPI000B5D09F8|nr:SWI/SNF-related matrix-associated actin-dependent regulator of chromatin subfamily A-like protein 1 isoform X4 [Manihot esculenta]